MSELTNKYVMSKYVIRLRELMNGDEEIYQGELENITELLNLYDEIYNNNTPKES